MKTYACRVSAETTHYFAGLTDVPTRYCEECNETLTEQDDYDEEDSCERCRRRCDCGRRPHSASENQLCVQCELEGCRYEFAKFGDEDSRAELQRWEQFAREAA